MIKKYLGCILLLLIPFSLFSEESLKRLTVDSLQNVLAQTNDPHKKIPLLRDLARFTRQTPQEVNFLTLMLETAYTVKADSICYGAISSLGRYYVNENRLDSILYWVSQLDSLAKERAEIPDEQFDIHNFLCRYYLINTDFELAMNEAVRLQILAGKSNNMMGLISCSENIGLIYMITERFREAIMALENSLALLKQVGNESTYEIQIGECLARLYLYESEFDKAEILLEDFEKKMIEIETSQDVRYRTYPSEKYRCILYSYRIWLYANSGNPYKMDEAREALLRYKDKVTIDENTYSIYYLALAHYYVFKGDLDQALSCLDKMAKSERGRYEVYFKIDILKRMGKNDEALAVCEDQLGSEKELSSTAYMRQVDQLRSLRILNEQEKESLMLKNQQIELDYQKKQLMALLFFLTILLLALFFLVRYIIRSWKLRKDLLKDEQFLIEMNNDLRLATDKAEKADRMKSHFVANISHEIRTPLNAIVGFSGLLQDSEAEERAEYIKVINNNSDLLLNLVSDVLDLSRLDADKLSLNIKQSDIQECCYHALDTVRNKVADGVKMTFTHPGQPLIVQTDPLRLQQLLLNLLSNACKFTEEGEINLDYRVETETGHIVFTVTDTGCGIPLEKLKVIFNRFEKVDDFKQGAGLGLSVCMAISNCFVGELYVDPAYTKGARFIFKCPINLQKIPD